VLKATGIVAVARSGFARKSIQIMLFDKSQK